VRESKRKRISTTKTNSEPNSSALVSVERVRPRELLDDAARLWLN